MAAEREIDFARYAEVSAYLGHFPGEKKDEVLGRLGHRRRAWEAGAARWAAARDAELLEGRADLTERFGNLVARTRERLTAQRPTVESLGPLPPPEEEAPPPPAPDPLPVTPPPEVKRSSAQIAPPPEIRPGMPSFLAAAPPPPPVLLVDVPAPPPAVLVPPARRFAATALVDASSRAPELPFQPGTPEQAERNALSVARATQRPSEPPRAGMLGETVATPAGAPAAALPFAIPLPRGCPDLTLPQYASLRVELQTKPAEEAAILARYQVAAGARADLDAHWRRRFEADPPLRMEFARAYASYVAWMRQQRG